MTITNDSGYVGMVRKQSMPKYVNVGNREYVFSVNRNISFAWIHPEDVDKVLAIPGDCNCPNNNKTQAFRIASDQEYRIHFNLSER